MRTFLASATFVALWMPACLAGGISVQFLPTESTVPAAGGSVAITMQVMGGDLTQEELDAGDAGETGPMAVACLVGSVTTSGTVSGAFSSGFALTPGVWAGLHADPWNTLPLPLDNGAWSVFGAQQNTVFADSNTAMYGLGQWVDFATFTVTIPAGQAGRSLTLSFEQDDSLSVNQVLVSLMVNQFSPSPVLQTSATIHVASDPQDTESPSDSLDPQTPSDSQDAPTGQDPQDTQTSPDSPTSEGTGDAQDSPGGGNPQPSPLNTLLAILSAWGTSAGQSGYNPAADLNQDNRVDGLDMMMAAFGSPGPTENGSSTASAGDTVRTLLTAVAVLFLVVFLAHWIFSHLWR